MKNERRTGKWGKVCAVGMAISLATAAAVFAGEGRKGAKVMINTGGAAMKGELVGVRPEILVVLTENSVVSVPTGEIERVRIINKASKFMAGWAGSGVGALASIPIARWAAGKTTGDWGDAIGAGMLVMMGGAVVGAVGGVLLADNIAKDEVLIFKDQPGEEIAKNLDRLRKQARVQDYK